MFSKRIVVVLFLVVLSGITGCDKITSFFSPKSSSNNPSPAVNQPNQISLTPVPSTPAVVSSNAISNAEIPQNALVKVGDWVLTKEDFKARLKNLKEAAPEFDIADVKSKKLVLDELVNQQLLIKEAEQSGVGNDKQIMEAVNEFKRTIMVRENINRLIENLQVSDQEAQDYYNQNKDIFVEPADWHLREIMVATQTEAKEILIELLKGSDFAETAKTRSKAKSAAAGGDLGFVKDVSPAMSRAIASIDVGGVSSVFKGPDGYYILKLEEKKGGKPLSFSDVKKDLLEGLLDIKRRQTLQSHLDELKQKESIQINESLLSE